MPPDILPVVPDIVPVVVVVVLLLVAVLCACAIGASANALSAAPNVKRPCNVCFFMLFSSSGYAPRVCSASVMEAGRRICKIGAVPCFAPISL
jgi:hypothetical protein